MKSKYFSIFAASTVVLTAFCFGVSPGFAVEPEIQTVVNAESNPNDGVQIRVSGIEQKLPSDIVPGETSIINSPQGETSFVSNDGPASANAVAAAETGGDIAISWDFSTSQDPVSIFLDGEFIGTEPSQGSLTTKDVNPSSLANLTLVQDQSDQSTSNAIDITTQSRVSLLLAAPLATAQASLLSVTPQATSTVLRYQTFIPFAWVKAPIIGCGMSLFYASGTGLIPVYAGNSRGFQMPSSNNKTAFQMNLDWLTSTATSNQGTGDTDGYLMNPLDGSTLHVYNGNAGTSGIKYSYAFYSTHAYVHLWENVENPDCAPGGNGIYYNVSGSVFKAGGYSLTGEFRNVPNHEFAYRDSISHSWQSIYQSHILTDLRFSCFIPGYPEPSGGCITSDGWYSSASRSYVYE